MPRRKVPDPLALAVGRRIRQLRLEQGLTAESLVFSSDLSSKGFMSDVEHGLALPTLKSLENIASTLNVALVDLLTFPTEGARQALIDRTRHLPVGTIRKLLEELSQSRPRLVSTHSRTARDESVLLAGKTQKTKKRSKKKC